MTSKESLIQALERASGVQTPALRLVVEMLSDKRAEVSAAPSLLAAEELQSVWSIRLWNSVLKARRIVGLRDFVRTLAQLSSSALLRQTTVRIEQKTALLFSDAESGEVVGVVISNLNAADRENSLRNLSFANGSQAPSFLTAQVRP